MYDRSHGVVLGTCRHYFIMDLEKLKECKQHKTTRHLLSQMFPFLRIARGIRSRVYECFRVPQTPSPALNIPVEIWLYILPFLTLDEYMNLSHTCTALRIIMSGRDWHSEARKLNIITRVPFLYGLTTSLLDHWMCACCYDVKPICFPKSQPPGYKEPHPSAFFIMSDDFPLPHIPYNAFQSDVPKSYNMDDEIPGKDPHYMKLSHIQLVLKYSKRFPSGLKKRHKEHLEHLLAPLYKDQVHEEDGRGVRRQFLALPKVKNGRFLLRDERVFTTYDPTKPLLQRNHNRVLWDNLVLGINSVAVCRHLVVRGLRKDGAPPTSRDETRLLSDLARAVASACSLGLGHQISLCCPTCPTNCQVYLAKDQFGYQSFVVQSWHDFGSEVSPRFGATTEFVCKGLWSGEVHDSSCKSLRIREIFEDGEDPPHISPSIPKNSTHHHQR